MDEPSDRPAGQPPDPAPLVDQVSEALEVGGERKAAAILTELEPAELAHVLESFPPDARPKLWELTGDDVDAETLLHMSPDAAAQLAEALGPTAVLDAADELDATDVAELVDVLPDDVGEDLLAAMDRLRREQVEGVLSFEEGTAGRLMHRDAVVVRADASVQVVQRYVARRDDLPENTDRLMVVDRDRRFVGTLGVVELVRRPPESDVREWMDADVVTVTPDEDEDEVAHLFRDHDLLSLPVVGADGAVLGRIVAEDVMDVMQAATERAILAQGGVREGEDLFAPVLRTARGRAFWLGINLLTAFLASAVIGVFEGALDKIVALAVLMPVVASMGGIAGSQTLSIVIRGLALDQIGASNTRRLLRKELGIGLINGLIWALVVGLVATAWFGDVGLGAVIGTAIVVNMAAAAVAGMVVPLVLDRAGVDPALAGAVVLTTVTDVVGFVSFLGLATVVLL